MCIAFLPCCMLSPTNDSHPTNPPMPDVISAPAPIPIIPPSESVVSTPPIQVVNKEPPPMTPSVKHMIHNSVASGPVLVRLH